MQEYENASLRKQLAEAQRRAREAEEAARKAEEAVKAQTLPNYLKSCHLLSLAIDVITKSTLTTKGFTTDPTGRLFPRRIIPWDDFAATQQNIWNQLAATESFFSNAVFPSAEGMKSFMSMIRKITSEHGLRKFEHITVEDAVEKLVVEAYNNAQVRSTIGLQGSVTFEDHRNFDDYNSIGLNEERDPQEPAPLAARAPLPSPSLPRRAAGSSKLADAFCVHHTSDRDNLVLAIEYKAPHKLRLDEIVTGLSSEVQPERDGIDQEGAGFEFASRSLAAAVVTQLFSYMIGNGIRYGYICTGEAFVFLRIADDPTCVHYSVCIPNTDVGDDENRLYGTAVAQVFAFVLQALRAEPPPPSWYDAAGTLDKWAVEYDDILRKIPETVRKEPRTTPYKPKRWQGLKRSPIRTRAQCKPLDSTARPQDDDADEAPPSPTLPRRSTRSSNKSTTTPTETGSGRKRTRDGKHDQQHGRQKQQDIKDRPYCTVQCLLGLATGRSMDKNCPNLADHGPRHLDRLEFLRLVSVQIAQDRSGADAKSLLLRGSIGSLFKVRLSSHGYTFVGKGFERYDLKRMHHENDVYDRLRAMQGKHIPACLGGVDLLMPLYHNGGVYYHLLCLSWGGLPLFDSVNHDIKEDAIDVVAKAFREMHRRGVVHCDAAIRNLLRDPVSGRVMVIDFERSKLLSRPPARSPGSASLHKKRRAVCKKEEMGGEKEFAEELDAIVASLSEYIEMESVPTLTGTDKVLRRRK